MRFDAWKRGARWPVSVIPRRRAASAPRRRGPPARPAHGWNYVGRATQRLFAELPDDPRFYFVQFYYVDAENEEDVAAYTMYDVRFVSAIERHNVLGVQFHPEKSHKFGMQLLRNFVEAF
jgi:glutamine amidotransferase